MQKINLIVQCLNRAKMWRCPVHWHPRDWQEELLAVARAALWEGISKGIRSEHELRRFIMASLMRRYRDEWNYGIRWAIPLLTEDWDDEERETIDGESVTANQHNCEKESIWLKMLIREALTHLNEDERYLIERQFWDGATETELAKELGISQPAVHKKLKRTLKRLRTLLELS
ncbi:MAG: sigma-70 family RNA polymerase sigma factor [Armatimonadetes bacterium]|nr:sigma-70 family RNA polymerase sigma factor [Armatimonadota bacterium]